MNWEGLRRRLRISATPSTSILDGRRRTYAAAELCVEAGRVQQAIEDYRVVADMDPKYVRKEEREEALECLRELESTASGGSVGVAGKEEDGQD